MTNRGKKRALALALSLALLVGLFPAAALADEGPPAPPTCALSEGCTLEDGHEGDCVPAPPVNDALVKTVTGWTFVDGENLTGGELALPGVHMDHQADFDTVVNLLPTGIRADIDGETEPATVDITGWSCDAYKRDENGNWPLAGDYTFTAALPEDYACDPLPAVKVVLGGAVVLVTGEPVLYMDADGTKKTCSNATGVTADDTRWGTRGTEAWYAVHGSVEITGRVTVTGNVHLILTDGCSLTVSGGIEVNFPDSLTIYGQENGTGSLTATSAYAGNAGIGGSSNSIGGINSGRGGIITINGGTVTANGGTDGFGAGIGGGSDGDGGTITINGGTVTATGGQGRDIGGGGAGIGGGDVSSGGTITINGGVVNATSNAGGGIGGGTGNDYSSIAGDITINGGAVTATGAVGIGGGLRCKGGNVSITGGTVVATGGIGSASPYNNRGTVTISGEDTIVVAHGIITEDTTVPYDIGFGVTLTVEGGARLALMGLGVHDNGAALVYRNCIIYEKGTPTVYGGGGTPATYAVTYEAPGASGTVPNGGEYATGASVPVADGSGLTNGNLAFFGWVSGYDTNIYRSKAFTMPGEPVTLTAMWQTSTPVASAGMDVSVGGDTNILSYADALDVAEWAVPAFQWACGAGIISGTSDTTLSPQAGADRAQLAAMLQRFIENT